MRAMHYKNLILLKKQNNWGLVKKICLCFFVCFVGPRAYSQQESKIVGEVQEKNESEVETTADELEPSEAPMIKKPKKKTRKRGNRTRRLKKVEAERIENNSSRFFRGRDLFELSLLYSPRSDLLLNYGFYLAYSLSPYFDLYFQNLFGAGNLINQTSDEEFQLLRYDEATGRSLQSVVGIRFFAGNSFNMTLGFGYRQVVANYRMIVQSQNKIYPVTGTLQAKSVVFESAVGNHWILSNGLVLGCDWISIVLPINRGFNYTVVSRKISEDAQKEVASAAEMFADQLSKAQTWALGLVYLGYRF